MAGIPWRREHEVIVSSVIGLAQALGLRTVADIAHTPRQTLVRALGEATGNHLHDRAWGRDHRSVEPVRREWDILIDELRAQVTALSRLVAQHADTPMVGRTLTQHAVPTTFGAVAAGWLDGLVDAADLVQELFLRFWRRPQIGIEALESYLMRCAGNIAIDHLRSEGARERVNESLPEPLELPQESQPEAAFEASSDLRRIGEVRNVGRTAQFGGELFDRRGTAAARRAAPG